MRKVDLTLLGLLGAVLLSCSDSGEESPGQADAASSEPDAAPTSSACAAEIAVGVGFTCVRSEDGRVWCWGTNESGQLTGNELETSVPVPRPVTGLRATAVRIAAGERHACAALSDGSVWCWGANNAGQLGNGAISDLESTPVQVQNLTGEILSLSASGGYYMLGDSEQPLYPVDHTCVVRADRTVWCWGSDNTGQVGGGVVSPDARVLTPRKVETIGAGFMQVSAGLYHTCARREDGKLECWGYLGGHPPAADVKPRVIDGADGVVSVSAGTQHTCVLNASGEARCWGNNDSGQCGQGSPMKPGLVETPSVVPLAQPASAINAGSGMTCAILQDKSVWCWGSNTAGQLGNGQVSSFPNASTATPTRALLASPALSLAARSHVCARVENDEVWCWGNRGAGALGDGIGGEPLTPSPVPTPVKVLDYCDE